MSTFNKYETTIINILYNSGRPLCTNEISIHTKMSRITAKKYLLLLYDKGYLRTKKTNNAQLWRIK